MPGELPLWLWPALALLAAFMVTNVMRTLAARSRHQIETHDLVRRSNALRQQYIQAVTRRRAIGRRVDIIDE